MNGRFFRTNLCPTEFLKCYWNWSTCFIWRNDIIVFSVTSQFSEKYCRLNELRKMSLEYVEIKYISYTTILWLSYKFIIVLFPKFLVWLFLIIHFQKYFSPQPLLHGISLRKKTGGLVDHDLVLYFQNIYFPTLLGKLHWEHRRDRNIVFEKLSVKLMMTPNCICQTVWAERIQKLLRFKWYS